MARYLNGLPDPFAPGEVPLFDGPPGNVHGKPCKSLTFHEQGLLFYAPSNPITVLSIILSLAFSRFQTSATANSLTCGSEEITSARRALFQATKGTQHLEPQSVNKRRL